MFSWKTQFSAKKFSLLPEIKNKISDEKIQNSAEKIQKITNRVDWMLSERDCDVIIMFIASTKIPERERASHLPAFMGNCLTISYTF